MPITLPSDPAPNGATPFLVDPGGILTPFLGGPTQRINRLGVRFGVKVSLPPMRSDSEALVMLSRLLQARQDEMLLDCPLVDGNWPAAGAAQVRVAVTGGTTLQFKGLTPGLTIGEGRFFDIAHGARRYLHLLAAPMVVDGSGNAAASIWPPMRTAFAVNDAVNFDAPKMLGRVVDEQQSWDMALARRTSMSFTVVETE